MTLGAAMGLRTMSPADELHHLDALASASLSLWDLPADATARRINVSENTTYLVEGNGDRAVLRIHRHGYQSPRAIACELAWSTALRDSGAVSTPAARLGRDGQAIQQGCAQGLDSPRWMVLFDHVPGTRPEETSDLTGSFAHLGALAARTHLHAMTWQRPEPFERLVWDAEAVFAPDARWGQWRAAPKVTPEISKVLAAVETTVCQRLQAFGKGPERYGLIHADMRLANLLVDGEQTHLIDFDDCGFGWHLYDFAAAISFIEDHPQVPALQTAWMRGYRSVRALPQEDETEIGTFVMLRRLALLAWIGSHMEAPEPQALAPNFARVSAELGQRYLDAVS